MRKKICIVLMVLSFFLFPTMNVYASERIEIDYGITFELTEDWERATFNTDTDLLGYKYESKEHGTLLIGVVDVWGELSSEEQKEIPRSLYNSSYIDKDIVRSMIGADYEINSIETEQHGGYEFYIVDLICPYTGSAEFDILLYNGYMLMFQHFHFSRADYTMTTEGDIIKNTDAINNHISILESVDLSSIEPVETSGFDIEVLWSNIIISLILTAVSYMLIPAIVRICHGIAFEKKKAFRIALINSIVVGLFWAVMTINAGEQWNAITCVVYFFINRFILSCKRRGRE